MGYLYKEIIECKHKKSLKYIMGGLIFLLLLDTLGTLILAYKGYAADLLLVGIFLFLSVTVPTYLIWVKTNCKYKYSIIDNELIIERLNGSRRRVLLNINLKTIEHLEKIDEKLKNNDKLREWKRSSFMEKRNNGYLCMYKVDGKVLGFCFEPSQKLLDKIFSAIGEKVVA